MEVLVGVSSAGAISFGVEVLISKRTSGFTKTKETHRSQNEMDLPKREKKSEERSNGEDNVFDTALK